MATKLDEAVEAIQQYAERNRAISQVAEVLTEIGSLELATKEAGTRRDAAIARLNETTTALEDATRKLAEIRTEADRSLTAAQKQSDETIVEARQEAEDIIKRGREDANNLLETARKDADAELAIQNDQLDALNGKIGIARQELELKHAELTEAEAKLNETNAAITAMKESAQKALS